MGREVRVKVTAVAVGRILSREFDHRDVGVAFGAHGIDGFGDVRAPLVSVCAPGG